MKDDEILGLPAALLGTTPLATLAGRKSESPLTWFGTTVWSPSGADLMAIVSDIDDGVSLTRVSFGRGLPGPATGFLDVPNWLAGEAAAVAFATDGSLLAVSDGSAGWLYQVSLQEPPLPTRRFQADIVDFCDDPTTWISSGGLLTLANDELVLQPFDGSFTLSPDQRWAVVDGAEAQLVRCAPEAEKLALGPADEVTWSPSSRYFANKTYDGRLRIFSIADSGEPIELWSHPSATFHGFSADSAKAVLELSDAERISMLELEGDVITPIELMLEAPAWLEMLGNDALLAREYLRPDPEADSEAWVVWLPLRADEPSQSVVRGFVAGHDAQRDMAVLRSTVGDTDVDDVLLARFGEEGFRLDLLSQMDRNSSYLTLAPAPDGSGVIELYDRAGVNSVDWFPIDATTGDLLPKLSLPLAEGAYHAEFQAWP
jgi:hypothetical protein